MRVRGNISPDIVSITQYEPIPGKVEVRVRENISQESGEDFEGFVYDEYMFIIDDKIGLRESIISNFDDWILTGRSLELNQNATLYLNAREDAIDEYTTELIELGVL